FAGLRQAVTQ
nr:Chain B, FAGLRQAVTQ peptide [synthetic construct]